MLYIDHIICHDNLESIQAVLCCAVYSIRSTKGTSHWYTPRRPTPLTDCGANTDNRKLAGQALRQCISLGYHRNQKRHRVAVSVFQREMQKRAFWSAYIMECAGAVMLGRPLSLRFEEIDAEVLGSN
jgi:hypothetical protein